MDASAISDAARSSAVLVVDDKDITDLALFVQEPSKSICFPGPLEIPGEFRDYCFAVLAKCRGRDRAVIGVSRQADVRSAGNCRDNTRSQKFFRLPRPCRFGPGRA